MTKEEVGKVFTLLQQFYPNARQLQDRTKRLAWELALKRFPYNDVKNAVVDYAIANKYFPDMVDITGGLKQEAAPVVSAPESRQEDDTWALPFIQKNFLHEAIPGGGETWEHAKNRGVPWPDWIAEYRTKGGFSSCTT